MERGLLLSAVFTTNGCQFVTYQNGTITLDKTNTNGPVGIYSFSTAGQPSGANSNNSFLNNTIQNVLKGYQLTGSLTVLDQSNTIGTSSGGTSVVTNVSSAGTTTATGVEFAGQNLLTVANTTFNTFSATASNGALYGVASAGASTNVAIGPGNTITGFTSAAASIVAGVYLLNSITGTVNGNTITSLTNSASGSSASLYGITTAAGAAKVDVYDNQVNNLSLTSATTNSSSLVGIDVASVLGQTVNVYRNAIHTLAHSTTTGIAYGIRVATGSTAASAVINIYNNLLSNISAHASNGNGGTGVRGISLSSTGTVNVYYNSVYLSGAATNASAQTSALYATTSVTSLDYRNNVLVNRTTGGTRHTAVYRTSTNVTTVATTSNNNLLQGTTGLYYDGSSLAVSLAQYRLAINGGSASTPRETAAVTEPATPFVGTADPHIVANSATQAEGGAQVLGAPFTDDYDQQTRSATTPDIGADEGSFRPLDLTPPTITYTPLTVVASNATVSQTNVVITDDGAGGVETGTGIRPRLYYKLSTDLNNTFNDNTSGTPGFKYVEASGTGGSPFSFTFNFALLPTTPTPGSTIQYFVVAQDVSPLNAPNPNVGINAGAFTNTSTGVNLTAAAFPVTGTLNSFLIKQSFGGSNPGDIVKVGPGQTYTALTTSTGLFNALNNGLLVGNLVVQITGDISIEDGNKTLLQLATLPANQAFSVLIQPDPASTAVRTVSGSMQKGFVLSGADNITFDGRLNGAGTTKYLRFRNTNTSTSGAENGGTFLLRQDATNNTIQHCFVEAAFNGTAVGAITISTSSTTANTTDGAVGGATGNSNNLVANCDISGTTLTAVPGYGIYSNSSVSAAANASNTIRDNNIFNWSIYGLYFQGSNGSNWTISGNSLYCANTPAGAQTGMYLVSATSATNWLVSGNYIGGNAPLATGTWTNATNSLVRGIHLFGTGTGLTPAVTVQNNVIANIALTNTGSSARFIGIDVNSGATYSHNTTGNTIENISVAGAPNSLGSPVVVGIVTASTASSSTGQSIDGNTIRNLEMVTPFALGTNAVVGIQVGGASGASGFVRRNSVNGLKTAQSGGQGTLIGVFVSNGDWTLANNQIAIDNSGGSVANTSGNVSIRGIYDNTSSAIRTEKFYFNSVHIGGTAAFNAVVKTYAYQRGAAASTATLRNNILVNERTGGSGMGGHFAIGVNDLSSFSSNYNNLYSSDATKLGEAAFTSLTFADWQSPGYSSDANSKNVRVKFTDVATGNLNLDATTNCQLDNAGVAIVGPPAINGEYDNAATDRQTTPDLGSDEFAYAPVAAGFANLAPVCGPASLAVTIAGSNGPFAIAYSIDGVAQTPITGASTGYGLLIPAQTAAVNVVLTKVTDAYGCDLTLAGTTVTVNPAATVDAGPATDAVCVGYTYTTTGTTGGGATQGTYTSSGTGTFSNGGVIDGGTTFVTYSPSAADITAGTVTLTLTSDDPAGPCGAVSDQLTLTINSSTTWTGAVSSEWNEPGNWSGGCVPNLQLSALVPDGTPNSIDDYGYVFGNDPAPANPLAQAQNLTIAPNAYIQIYAHHLELSGNLSNSGNMYLLANDGAFSATDLRFVGSGPQTVAGLPDVYNLAVANTGGSTVSVTSLEDGNTSFEVNGSLVMTSGILSLDPSLTAVLLPFFGGGLTETETSYVLGKVQSAMELTDNTPAEFNGLGLTLNADPTSTTFPGQTTVTRTTGVVVTGINNNPSIKRQYRIEPENDANLNMGLTFGYFDHERNGIAVSNLTLFSRATTATGSTPWQPYARTTGQAVAPSGGAPGTIYVAGLTHLSDWTLGSSLAPLPVELLGFEARREGRSAVLDWTTATERNNRGFEVQTSTDGCRFQTLGFVAGAGNSTAPRSYRFLDAEAGKASLRYYRLRQVDADGTASFSPVRTVLFDAATTSLLTAAPNPFEAGLTLHVTARTAQADAPLTVTDAAGRKVYSTRVSLQAGDNQVLLDGLAQLPAGSYLLQLPVDGKVQHCKLLKR